MKICTNCKQEKSLLEFSFKGYKKDKSKRYQPWCKTCNTVYQQDWYSKNRDEHIINVGRRTVRYKKQVRAWLLDYLKNKKCVDCGIKDYRVLQFDHVKDKRLEISVMINRGFSLSSIQKEVNKCEVRCANCHTIKTGIDFNWWWSKL